MCARTQSSTCEPTYAENMWADWSEPRGRRTVLTVRKPRGGQCQVGTLYKQTKKMHTPPTTTTTTKKAVSAGGRKTEETMTTGG